MIIRVAAPRLINIVFGFLPRKKDTLLIIKTDGIGDYILFRNYLSFLKQSQKHKHYKIYVLANATSKDLAEHFDSDTVDDFFWYADGYFLQWKLLKLLLNLQLLQLNSIIYTNYSRKYAVDWIVKNINAKHKTGVDGDLVNQAANLKQKTDKYYTQLIKMPPNPVHEFERNKQLFEIITGEKCSLTRPYIDKSRLNLTPDNNIVIFTGASDSSRKWDNKNFNVLCKMILSNLDSRVILAGGKDEVQDGFKIEDGLAAHDNFFNKIGTLNLVQLCELIGSAKLLISADTVAIHIAAALCVPAICISKGDLYGRFIPYPGHVANNITCIYPNDLKANDVHYAEWSKHSINTVLPKDVYTAIENVLKIHKYIS
ncbi:glycosyltransferase family 9 protein [Mucilaginibacter pocheonensis]|uniref:ADP-heptose:LPS heptosyltransferase n=1 Tax=Mucilaginibacter pocheonensis TaxID=398050 RepID=A0ABU1T4W0_9SPHI|nr:glycosyltransferase family 9 protein [Mucilaginibacter pocheonensis]MDR6940420.1 ADP-heptose:LPS heptosyltransferase [Mucilaginibacter pocheonensis]